jgi:hypothetical protein
MRFSHNMRAGIHFFLLYGKKTLLDQPRLIFLDEKLKILKHVDFHIIIIIFF